MMSIAVMTYFIIILFGRKRHVETETWIKRQSKIDRETETESHTHTRARAQRNVIIIYIIYIYVHVYCGYRGGRRVENRVADGNANPGLKHS